MGCSGLPWQHLLKGTTGGVRTSLSQIPCGKQGALEITAVAILCQAAAIEALRATVQAVVWAFQTFSATFPVTVVVLRVQIPLLPKLQDRA